ncbi:MAG: lytic transglycosylase domain-containing protein [Verrucomicrobiota bacterium]
MKLLRKIYLIGGCFLICLAVYFFWRNRREQHFDQEILTAAQRYEVDPALIKAVVWRETKFDSTARGKAHEIGLMQIREAAALDWASAEKIYPFEHEEILDPGTNTLVGGWYLKKLLKRYTKTDNPIPYALADYNAGRGNVLKWIGGAAATNSEIFIQQIGFPGTSNYVRAVMGRVEKYRQDFPEEKSTK